MFYFIAVFRSRNDAVGYMREMNSLGVRAMTVSTPPNLKIGCGMCVKIAAEGRAKSDNIIGKYKSFWGYYD